MGRTLHQQLQGAWLAQQVYMVLGWGLQEEGFHQQELQCTKFAGLMGAMMLTFLQHLMMQ